MITFKEYSSEFDEVLESVEITEEEQSLINEVLDTAARLKKKQQFVRRRARIQLAKKVQSRRLADPQRLKTRARQRARNLLIKRLYQGRSRSEIPIAQRKQVDQRLGKMSGAVKRISGKLLRRVKQEDIARKSKKKLPKFNTQSGF